MKRKSGGSARGAGWWLSAAIAVAGAVATGWLVVKTSAVDALVTVNPYVASTVPTADPRIAIEIAMAEFSARGGRVTEPTKRKLFAAAREAPLADEPFLLAAVDALVQKDRERAEQLLLAARRRDPRSDFARLLLLDSYLRRNKILEATQEMSSLAAIAPGAGDLLVAELARFAQNPDTAAALEKALKADPRFRDRLLGHLASNNADPDLILRLANNVPAPPGAAPSPPWQGQLITSLAERGQIARAYELWRTFSAPRAPEKKVGVHDGRFQGLPGGAPFGWNFPASPAGVAERTAARVLQVGYYGRDPAELATQLLMLPPGAHRLSVRAEGDAEGRDSRLAWKIQCQQSKSEIADLVLRKLTYAPRIVSVNFTVPASGCSAQWLRLVGAPGEFAKAQNAAISAVQIESAR